MTKKPIRSLIVIVILTAFAVIIFVFVGGARAIDYAWFLNRHPSLTAGDSQHIELVGVDRDPAGWFDCGFALVDPDILSDACAPDDRGSMVKVRFGDCNAYFYSLYSDGELHGEDLPSATSQKAQRLLDAARVKTLRVTDVIKMSSDGYKQLRQALGDRAMAVDLQLGSVVISSPQKIALCELGSRSGTPKCWIRIWSTGSAEAFGVVIEDTGNVQPEVLQHIVEGLTFSRFARDDKDARSTWVQHNLSPCN